MKFSCIRAKQISDQYQRVNVETGRNQKTDNERSTKKGETLKGLVHPKMKILLLITHFHVVPNP